MELNNSAVQTFAEVVPLMNSVEILAEAMNVYANTSKTPIERETVKGLFISRAKELGLEREVRKIFSVCQKREEAADRTLAKYDRETKPFEWELEEDARGSYTVTVNNFKKILLNDPHFEGVRYNVVSNSAEIHRIGADGKLIDIRPWTDADEAATAEYIEHEYKIYSKEKIMSALRLLWRNREYNPITDYIEGLPKWKGKESFCEQFLHKWAHCEDSRYVREVSRLIFAGGINRAYNPGCKFDCVPVLIGTKQGEGKSTLVRYLAVHDNFFHDMSTQMDSDKSVEAMAGKWIIELAELASLTRTKEQENAKAFITRQRDKYRKPYDRNPTEIPRRCIFIGTTNTQFFLRDLTGNRRYFPVVTNCDGYEIAAKEKEIREYINLCWAEARDRYKGNGMPPYADPHLADLYQEAQEGAMQEDWRIGAVKEYLDNLPQGAVICTKQVFKEALYPDGNREPELAECREIATILTKHNDLEQVKGRKSLKGYGQQRCWMKRQTTMTETDEEVPF